MSELIQSINSPDEISLIGRKLRESLSAAEITPNTVLEVFEAWAATLGQRDTADIPGVQFLRIWLRRGTLEPIVVRELGCEALDGEWMKDGRARLKAFPLGVVGHWPAGNIEIQPLL